MIPRLIEKNVLRDLIADKKTILMLGARQVGKTTLVKNIEKKLSLETKSTNQNKLYKIT